ncbi:MAG: DMT family transporter [Clostridia bacterium]|nr:DMT family transporter [Clostridia bacterium]
MNKKLYLIILVMGVFTATINGANAQLANHLGLLPSVLMIHLIGLSTSLLYFRWFNKGKYVSVRTILKKQPYLLLGGFIGSFAVVLISYQVQQVGVFLVSTGIIAGQFLASFFIDHFGWFGFEKVKMGKQQFIAMAMMSSGVCCLML